MSTKTLPAIVERASLFIEGRLPWRTRQWLYNRRLDLTRRQYDKEVLTTRPFVTSDDHPHFEVHILLGHKHVGMALWCVKSLLHYAKRKYRVVLHDDGSLTDRDAENLRQHLINSRIIRRSEADELMREKLGHLPNCSQYRFLPLETTDHRGQKYNMRIFAIRLFDFNLVSGATKTFVLDADILFFRKPLEIMEWGENSSYINSLHSVEQYAPKKNARKQIIGYERKFPTPTWANAGMLCFDKRDYDLELIEEWISRDKDMMDTHATFEQRMYNLLLQHQGGSVPLPDTYSFNYTDEMVVATHFAIKHLFYENIPRIQRSLSSLE